MQSATAKELSAKVSPTVPELQITHMNTFICAICHETFEKGVTDEEANAEALDIWGVPNASQTPGMALICDDCFNRRSPEDIRAMGDEFKSNNPERIESGAIRPKQ